MHFKYIRTGLKNNNMFAVIPYTDNIQASDRDGISVLDKTNNEELAIFQNMVEQIRINCQYLDQRNKFTYLPLIRSIHSLKKRITS